MADNVIVDNVALTDYTVSTDEGAGGHVQRVKLTYSANGSETHVTADADGLLVNLGTNNDVTVTGTVTVDSELPAAASLADNTANPTVPGVGAYGMLWDGVTWDRAPGTAADGQLVNLGANNDVTVTGTVTVQDGGATISVDDGAGSLTVDGTVSISGAVDTELPAAAALSDNFANPTAPGVGAFNMVWDGATWDRAPGTAADGLLVNLGANNDVTITGSVTVDSELPAAAALADNAANPTAPAVGAFGMLWDGATWDRAAGTAADGALVNLGANNDVQGQAAHDAAISGNPVRVGGRALAHGTNPTAVAAGDQSDIYVNRAGVPWVIGGHPNVVTFEYMATSAQTNDAIVTVGAGTKIVVTECEAMVDNATTVDVGVRIGFGAASVPAEAADGAGVAGVILSHPGIAPGSGVVRGTGAGILGVGGDDEDLRITSEVPTTGKLRVLVSYYTIES